MGDLDGVVFQTGLPAGEYCDIIHACAQTVSVGPAGLATITRWQDNDPVVAICVGCGSHKMANVSISIV